MEGLTPEFRTTRWSMVLRAGRERGSDTRSALADLCETYWYPLYAYARRRGLSPPEAEDRTQSFFAALLEKGWVEAADPERGRFRGYLITAFRRHLGHERAKERTVRRGGGRRALRLDFARGEQQYGLEPAHTSTPERLFDRRWALTVLEGTLDGLRREMEGSGRKRLFVEMRAFLPGAATPPPQHEVAARLGMSEGAVKVAVHRLRQRYRERLRAEVAQTVKEPGEIDDEIRDLLSAL